MSEERPILPAPPPRTASVTFVRVLVAAGALVALLAAAILVPLPMFVVFGPGPIRDVERLVSVDGATTYTSDGHLYLTTVSVDVEVPLVEVIAAGLSNSKSVESREALTGGRSLEEAQRQQRREMQLSQRAATIVALEALDIAEPEGDGAVVADLLPDFPASKVLRAGDVIVAMNDRKISTLCDVGHILDGLPSGREIAVEIVRGGERQEVSVATTENPDNPDRAFLGIAMRPDFDFDTKIDVEFETGEIAGPSAGLMFSLALYDRLVPEDLTGGREIAGTGTIACDGGVGPIGGIEEKITAAEAQGIEVFLTPFANVADARSVAREVEIVPIGSFQDALDHLRDLDG